MFFPTAELASGVPHFRPDFRGPDLHRCWAARSAASGKRKRPPAQRKIFGFHNPHYRFPDTELSGICARAPRQNTDFVAGISDFWRSEAVSAKFSGPKSPDTATSEIVTFGLRNRHFRPPKSQIFACGRKIFGKIANHSLVF